MIDEKTYLICCNYYYNHIKNKDKIDKWSQYYSDLLYGDLLRRIKSTIVLPPVYWKRMYNTYGKEALDMLEDNISYCELRLQIEKKKKEDADIKKTRRKEI